MAQSLAVRGIDKSKILKDAIAAIRETGLISAGWKAAGVSEPMFWQYRRDDPKLEESVQSALRQGIRRNMERGHGITTTLLDEAEEAAPGTEGRDTRREALDWLSRFGVKMAQAKLPEYQRTVRVEGEITHKHELVSSVASDFLAGHRPELIECESETVEEDKGA